MTTLSTPFRDALPARALACLLLILAGPLLEAQEDTTGDVSGRVLNARTGRYLNQAEITVRDTSVQVFTNQFGEYQIYNLEPGTYTVEASFTGLETQRAEVTVRPGESSFQDFTFARRQQAARAGEEGAEPVFELQEFVVDANDFQSMQEIAIQEERFSVNLKNVVSADAYGTVAQGNIGEFVKFIPGVQVDYGGTYSSGADASAIRIRGYDASQTGITIDGIPVSNAQPGSLTRAIGLDMLSINNAARVEVIKVPTPDQPESSIAGTVNLVSKTAFEYPEPKLSYRLYLSGNSENTEFFKKTPGPVNKSTYKNLPGLDLTYALPLNQKIGFTFTLATSNNYNENHKTKLDWQRRVTSTLGPVDEFVSEDGTVVENVYPDATRPYLNNIQISDAPRFSHRHSGAMKMDYRPFEGVLITANYQGSIFESAEANRIFEMNAGGQNIGRYGPDFMESRPGNGKSDLIVRAFDREGTTHSAYLKASYIKGPWDIRSHISHSVSNGDLLSVDNGHFSEIQVGLGGIEKAGFYEIEGGIPGRVEYYDDEGEPIDPASLSEYNITGYNPNDPQASSLRVLAGQTKSQNSVQTAKIDVRRDLDFIPWDWMKLAVKVGAYYESDEEEKEGNGTGYGYQYLGQSGVTLSLDDFRDDGYANVSPGFGFEAREWPDTYKLYKFFLDNPEAFSDSYDIPQFSESGNLEETSVAAENYISYVNTQKGVTEEKTDWYLQLEGKFFNNRLDIVGGVRQSASKRSGRTRFVDSNWASLRTGKDENGDGVLDLVPADLQLAAGGLYQPNLKVEDAEALEALGATYGDGTPFQAGFSYDGTPMQIFERRRGPIVLGRYYYQELGGVRHGYLVQGTLSAAQLQYIPNYEVDEESTGRPSPIVSASYDLTDKITLRASWSRSYAKRDFEGPFGVLTNSGVRIIQSDSGGTIFIQNPDLKPWEADSYDFAVSYYTESGGKFTASYFIKEERDFHVSDSLLVTEGNRNELLPRFGLPNSPLFEGWYIETTRNGEGTATTSGYELEVSQSLGILGNWGKYFYVYGSYSVKERNPSDESGDVIGPSADKFAAGGLNFNYKRFSARLNATWRTDKIRRDFDVEVLPDPTVSPSDQDPILVNAFEYEPSQLKIDINLSYRLTDKLSIDFSARNITNTQEEIIIQTVDDTYPAYAQVLSREEFGVAYTIGISGEF